MKIIDHFEIIMGSYHGEDTYRIKFQNGEKIEESTLCTLSELQDIIPLWQTEGLKGSFGIGTVLSQDYTYKMLDNFGKGRSHDNKVFKLNLEG